MCICSWVIHKKIVYIYVSLQYMYKLKFIPNRFLQCTTQYFLILQLHKNNAYTIINLRSNLKNKLGDT